MAGESIGMTEKFRREDGDLSLDNERGESRDHKEVYGAYRVKFLFR